MKDNNIIVVICNQQEDEKNSVVMANVMCAHTLTVM